MALLRSEKAGPAATGESVRLAGAVVELDVGGVHCVDWPDAPALARELVQLAAQEAPVVRFAGGALIADLSLHDNLMLEWALHPALRPAGLLGDLEHLFASAGCPLQRASWHATYPQQAGARDQLQVRVGRALMADPDVLVVDDDAWDEALLTRERFSQAFATQHPWRALVWARTQAGQVMPGNAAVPATAS